MIQILAVILLIIVVFAVLLWQGQSNWSQYTSAQSQKVKVAASQEISYINLEEVNELPEPVKRYFHLVLKDGAPIINRAFISQVGGFRAKPEMKKWSKMEAEQYFSSSPRAFVWNSTISIAPALSISICDSYIDGKGEIKGKLLALFTLINAQNQRELDEGALQRYLAEAVYKLHVFVIPVIPNAFGSWESFLKNDSGQAGMTEK